MENQDSAFGHSAAGVRRLGRSRALRITAAAIAATGFAAATGGHVAHADLGETLAPAFDCTSGVFTLVSLSDAGEQYTFASANASVLPVAVGALTPTTTPSNSYQVPSGTTGAHVIYAEGADGLADSYVFVVACAAGAPVIVQAPPNGVG